MLRNRQLSNSGRPLLLSEINEKALAQSLQFLKEGLSKIRNAQSKAKAAGVDASGLAKIVSLINAELAELDSI